MQGRVGLVGEVWVLQRGGVVLNDALDEDEVVEVDGAPEADGDVDPAGSLDSWGWEVLGVISLHSVSHG